VCQISKSAALPHWFRIGILIAFRVLDATTMSNLTILRSYAQKANPASLPPSILLTHSATSLTIFDAYPKSIFHFLIMPRVVSPLTIFDLSNLRTLLKCRKELAKEVLLGLKDDANKTKGMIEEEMVTRYGFKWGVWIGFHGTPSME
jgi:aprataxin